MTEKEFLSFGYKGNSSKGEGLGGYYISRFVDSHYGKFQIIRDENPVHFRISLPQGDKHGR